MQVTVLDVDGVKESLTFIWVNTSRIRAYVGSQSNQHTQGYKYTRQAIKHAKSVCECFACARQLISRIFVKSVEIHSFFIGYLSAE